jgi:hypothetical protein
MFRLRTIREKNSPANHFLKTLFQGTIIHQSIIWTSGKELLAFIKELFVYEEERKVFPTGNIPMKSPKF